jgi:4-amino-4-deoxy-L-arabinose transferase-like glycosyltransferase
MEKKQIIHEIWPFLCLIPGCLLYAINLNEFPAYFWDEGHYLRISNYLVEGDGYTFMYSLGGSPLLFLLFSVFRPFGASLLSLRVVSAAFSMLSGVLVYKLANLHLPRSWSIVAAYVYYLDGANIVFGRMALFDPGLTFFSLLAFYGINCYYNAVKKAISTVPDLHELPGDKNQLYRNDLEKINKRFFYLISITSLCAVFSKMTGLFLLLFMVLLILFKPSIPDKVEHKAVEVNKNILYLLFNFTCIHLECDHLYRILLNSIYLFCFKSTVVVR